MARVTVYIRDDLLGRAKEALGDEVKVSQLVQRGLESLLGSGLPAYAQRPDEAEVLLESARQPLLESARRDFQEGYRAATERAKSLPWRVLEDISDDGFDIARWADAVRTSAAHELTPQVQTRGLVPEWLWRVAEDLGALLDPIGFDEISFRRTQPYIEGYGAAFRDLWSSINSPVDPLRESPESVPTAENGKAHLSEP